MKGYRTGRYQDGSIIVFDLLETETKDGLTTEGRRRYLFCPDIYDIILPMRRFLDRGR
jgi:hypothetical protein